MRRSLSALSTLLALSAPALAQGELRALIVSGANNHDWEWSTPAIQQLLEASGKFSVTVTTDPATTLADAERLRGFDVLVLDYNGPRWGAEAEANFVSAVSGGVGVAVVHAANNAFEGWTDYETLVGDLWRAGTGHGRFHAFDVPIARRDHPVTATLPDLRAHPDELYHDLWRAPAANHEVLASAMSSEESGGTGEQEPMILVGSFGEGRVFHTPLGHVWRGKEDTRASYADPQLHTLLVRGTEWAASGEVTIPVPAGFPDAEAVSVVPPGEVRWGDE